MAEGYAKSFLPDWDVRSAGIRADGLNQRAVQAMSDDGIDISDQKSQVIDEKFMQEATIVITLCGEARDKCIIPQHARWLHWPINDPALASGSEEEIAKAFIEARDEIKQDVSKLADYLKKQL